MKKTIKFTKMHGSGNDYIYINDTLYNIAAPEEFSIKWSRPHFGIGSDGVVLISKSSIADFKMRIFNADGSEAKMCGNASRCIGKYVYDNRLTDKQEITLETLSGIKTLKLEIKDNYVSRVTVDMGKPSKELVEFGKEEKGEMVEKAIEVDNITYTTTAISMGNPHLVIFVDNVEDIELEKIGPKLENHPFFPDRINVEFAQILKKDKIRMRVWERGSGITQACGTGACATAVAGVLTGKTDRKTKIIMDGGILEIDWDLATDKVYMTGDAIKVFDGEIEE